MRLIPTNFVMQHEEVAIVDGPFSMQRGTKIDSVSMALLPEDCGFDGQVCGASSVVFEGDPLFLRLRVDVRHAPALAGTLSAGCDDEVSATFQLIGEQDRTLLRTGPVPIISRPPPPAVPPVWVNPGGMGALGPPQPWDFAWLRDLAGLDVVWKPDAEMPSLYLADVPPCSQLYQLVCDQFACGCRGGPTQLPAFDVVSVRAVHNSDLSTVFLHGLRTTNLRRGSGLEACNQPIGIDAESQDTLQRLKKLFLSQNVFDRANVLYAFHGCSPDVALAIARAGAAALRSTDGGYFGAGIYTTLQAQYAAGYSIGYLGNVVMPPPDGLYAILLCLVAVSNVYPVTRTNDYPEGSRVSLFHCNYPEGSAVTTRKDKALKAGFDAHMVAISETSNFEAAMPGDHGVWDELVVDQERQLLPLAIVYFRPRQQ